MIDATDRNPVVLDTLLSDLEGDYPPPLLLAPYTACSCLSTVPSIKSGHAERKAGTARSRGRHSWS